MTVEDGIHVLIRSATFPRPWLKGEVRRLVEQARSEERERCATIAREAERVHQGPICEYIARRIEGREVE